MTRERVERKIAGYLRRQTLADVAAVACRVFAVALIGATVALLMFRSPWYGLLGLLALFTYRRRSHHDRLLELDQRAGFRGDLATAINLRRHPQTAGENYSGELIQAHVQSVADRAASVRFNDLVDYQDLRTSGFFLLVTIALCLLYPACLPARYYYALTHEVAYTMTSVTGPVPRGSSVVLELTLDGVYLPRRVTITRRTASSVEHIVINPDQAAFRIGFQVTEPFSYSFAFLDQRTPERRIAILEPVSITSLEFDYQYPAYTQLRNETKTSRQLVAPIGTVVRFRGRASQPIDSAFLDLGARQRLDCRDDTFTGSLVIRGSASGKLILHAATVLSEPITVYGIPDLDPLLEVIAPGGDIDLPPGMVVDIAAMCGDDYGLEHAWLVQESADDRLEIPLRAGAVEDTVEYRWDLSNLLLLPGDAVHYHLEVSDNGGNCTRSETYSVRFPDIEQIYDEVAGKRSALEEDLAQYRDEHDAQAQQARRLSDKLDRERDMDWPDREKLAAILGEEEEILDKIDDWQDEIARTIEKLDQGIMVDPETMEHLEELMRLLDEIAPDELRRALENVKAQLEKRPEDIRRVMETLKRTQDELARALERMLELMKRFQEEERLRVLAENLEDLARDAALADSATANAEPLDPEVRELLDKLDSLAREMDQLADSEGLDEASQQGLREAARRAGQMTNEFSGDKQALRKQLEQLAADVAEIYDKLVRDRKAQLVRKLMDTIRQLIDASRAQESIASGEAAGPTQGDVLRATQEIAESLYAQQTKSLFVSPTIGKRLNRALDGMKQAQQAAQRGQSGITQAREAMQHLNLVTTDLLRALEQAAQSGSSSGMDQFLKQLSEIAQGQMSLSQSMNGLLPIPVSGLSPEQMAQVQRMAGAQRELRQALEQLAQTQGAGQYSDLLNELSREMQEMERALDQYQIDRRLLERQQRIISRLLDAERSARRQDYRDERKSQAGQDVVRTSPRALSGSLGVDELRSRIQQALREPFPAEYEALIREYFDALLEKAAEP